MSASASPATKRNDLAIDDAEVAGKELATAELAARAARGCGRPSFDFVTRPRRFPHRRKCAASRRARSRDRKRCGRRIGWRSLRSPAHARDPARRAASTAATDSDPRGTRDDHDSGTATPPSSSNGTCGRDSTQRIPVQVLAATSRRHHLVVETLFREHETNADGPDVVAVVMELQHGLPP